MDFNNFKVLENFKSVEKLNEFYDLLNNLNKKLSQSYYIVSGAIIRELYNELIKDENLTKEWVEILLKSKFNNNEYIHNFNLSLKLHDQIFIKNKKIGFVFIRYNLSFNYSSNINDREQFLLILYKNMIYFLFKYSKLIPNEITKKIIQINIHVLYFDQGKWINF